MDHRLSADDTRFRSSAHLLGEQSHPSPVELIESLERAWRLSLAISRR
jgi:hypothetical protein